MDQEGQDQMSVLNHICQKERWQTQTMCRLSSTKGNHEERLTSTTPN